MEIVVQSGQLAVSEALRTHVARSLERALAGHRLWVRRIEVQLSATACVVRVRLHRLLAIAVRQPGSDLYTPSRAPRVRPAARSRGAWRAASA